MPWQQQTGLPIRLSVSLGQRKWKSESEREKEKETESRSEPEWARLGATQEYSRVRQTGQTAASLQASVLACRVDAMQGDGQ